MPTFDEMETELRSTEYAIPKILRVAEAKETSCDDKIQAYQQALDKLRKAVKLSQACRNARNALTTTDLKITKLPALAFVSTKLSRYGSYLETIKSGVEELRVEINSPAQLETLDLLDQELESSEMEINALKTNAPPRFSLSSLFIASPTVSPTTSASSSPQYSPKSSLN